MACCSHFKAFSIRNDDNETFCRDCLAFMLMASTSSDDTAHMNQTVCCKSALLDQHGLLSPCLWSGIVVASLVWLWADVATYENTLNGIQWLPTANYPPWDRCTAEHQPTIKPTTEIDKQSYQSISYHVSEAINE